ncbi:hypothetical protein SNE40_005116 [Patella caerulea]|uniref:Major facilitator superfamily (MFS) profile domain-containing protein n=1 Tax=Patella caerulea TaxID=87958 RepID=A0AAN8Q1U9_PATCE
MANHLDELLACLGKPGRYQTLIFICLALNYCPLVFNHVIMAFFGSPPPHTCVAGKHLNVSGMSAVLVQTKNEKCESTLIFDNNETRSMKCSGDDWMFFGYDREKTIVTEWDLVCDDSYLSGLATTIYFCGVMVGGLLFGWFADQFGRRPIMLFCLYLPIPIGIGISFANSYILFVVLRFFQGILMQGLQTSSYILAMELVVPRHRPYIGAFIECFWGASVITVAGLAYFIRNWRYIQLAISIPSVIAVFYICFVPESLRWLIMRKKFDEAGKLIEKTCRVNKLPVPNNTWEIIKNQSIKDSSRTNYNFVHLLKTPELRKRSLIMFYCWVAVAVGYYGLTFKITSLAGNKYLNFFIGAVVEFIAYVLAIGVMRFFGRKKPMIFYGFFASVTCIIAGALPKVSENGTDLTMISTGFAIAGRFSMAGMFSVIFLFTSELYPTVIRNIGLGTCAFWARLGGVIAPQINSLSKFASSTVPSSIPVIVFGVMTFIAAFLIFLLPETHNQKLADTIEDVENKLENSIEKDYRVDNSKQKDTPSESVDTRL